MQSVCFAAHKTRDSKSASVCPLASFCGFSFRWAIMKAARSVVGSGHKRTEDAIAFPAHRYLLCSGQHVRTHAGEPAPYEARCSRELRTIPPRPFRRGEGRGEGASLPCGSGARSAPKRRGVLFRTTLLPTQNWPENWTQQEPTHHGSRITHHL